MSWKDIFKEKEDYEEVTEALDKLEALYYELSQLDYDGVLDSKIPDLIKEALALAKRVV